MLEGWINEWLVQAFMKNDDGKLPGTNNDVRYRITTVRSDFCDDGEAILSRNNKNECFVAYNFGIRLEYQGILLLRGRSIGDAKGVIWIRNIGYDDSPEVDVERQIDVYGDWEEGGMSAHQQQQHKGGREPTPYEQEIKGRLDDTAGGEIRERVGRLRSSLAEIAEGGGVDIPDASEAARGVKLLDPEDTETMKVQAQAAQATNEFVDDVRRKHRSARFIAALEDPALETVAVNLCDLRASDLEELVVAMAQNCSATCFDLRQNAQLDDGALQPLLIALASPCFMPNLQRLKLQGTSASLVSQNMTKGLRFLRKGLIVEFD